MTTALSHDIRALNSIGMRLTGGTSDSGAPDADIESTLLDIAMAFPEDPRLAAVTLAWIKVHGNYVIVEKLGKFAQTREGVAENLPWLSMIAAWAFECGYHKWRKLVSRQRRPKFFYPESVSTSAIEIKGAMPWLDRIGILIPEGSLRIRERDVLEPFDLIKRNRQYRNRYIFGPSWRADIITAVQNGITNPTHISRAVGCSYEPAYRISREYLMATAETPSE